MSRAGTFKPNTDTCMSSAYACMPRAGALSELVANARDEQCFLVLDQRTFGALKHSVRYIWYHLHLFPTLTNWYG